MGSEQTGMVLRTEETEAPSGLTYRFMAAGVVLGIGLGGFVDGIVLHQILQWHHMLTATGHHPMTTVEGLQDNTLWDGLFHSLTWAATSAGLALLWVSRPVSRGTGAGVAFFGLMVLGWGLFNVVEGAVNHHILTLHHVRDDLDSKLPWDIGFLVLGGLLIASGGLLARQGHRMAQRDEAG